MLHLPPRTTLVPYTTLFRSEIGNTGNQVESGLLKLTVRPALGHEVKFGAIFQDYQYSIGQMNTGPVATPAQRALYQGSSVYASDRKSTRLNSSHTVISYAVF